ncbi:hypothetical protein SAMD00019534_052280 [Acytostelium subglobosum LB1]|uniref:hypothetical protein n=1 Tax=Acytostelium subglobosum LB1 TaxID=1410327 RepID=UPI00064503B8|nr:hypothetical protein SAMD00019534_052280 [Acytostelium subglobosum LB1]GAM22053.1 hypothetical protein SAMD00019534_052280 [Acytostelium subglobosum LB1]|eukprot:XP_012755153.1 hypothetical protein SAMD00019534_052280 [Acytostelium subglobosum LB1]
MCGRKYVYTLAAITTLNLGSGNSPTPPVLTVPPESSTSSSTSSPATTSSSTSSTTSSTSSTSSSSSTGQSATSTSSGGLLTGLLGGGTGSGGGLTSLLGTIGGGGTGSIVTINLSSDSTTSSPKNNTVQVYTPNCNGTTCPNGTCVVNATSCSVDSATQRCPTTTPYRCDDGTCATDTSMCTSSNSTKCEYTCPNGKCAPCESFDGCPLSQPYQCPNGLCAKSQSYCQRCDNDQLRCFDGSCLNPCPDPPYYYKPIPIETSIPINTVQTLIPVNSYSNPSDYSTSQKNVLDITIEPETFPANTSFSVLPVADSYVETITIGSDIALLDTAFQLNMLSSVINITAVHQGIEQTKFDKRVKLTFKLTINMGVQPHNVCLAYIDVMSNRWVCIPGAVESVVDGQVTTYTDHFTSFALLTTMNGDGSGSGSGNGNGNEGGILSIFNDRRIMYGLIAGCFGLVIVVLVVGVLLHYRSKHGGVRRWLVVRRGKSQQRLDKSTDSISSSTSSSPSTSPPSTPARSTSFIIKIV